MKKRNRMTYTKQYKLLNEIIDDANKILIYALDNYDKPNIQAESIYKLKILEQNALKKVPQNSKDDAALVYNRFIRDYKNAFTVINDGKLLEQYQATNIIRKFTVTQQSMVNKLTLSYQKDLASLLIKENTLLDIGAITREDAIKLIMKEYKGPTVTFSNGRQYPAQTYFETLIQDEQTNAARDIGKDLAEEFGTEIFYYSERTPAVNPREACSNLEGKLVAYGWSGEVEDGNGEMIEVFDLYDFGYGEADGALGIRCGHDIMPFIPKISVI